MNFIASRDFRLRPGQVWERLKKKKEMVITSNGKPIALLTGINADNLEETIMAIRHARAEIAVSKMRQVSHERGNSSMTLEDIEAEIDSTRQSR